jgi:3-isopropylmalate/(R)-2-methylmalate dehydratase small subunit
VGHPARRVRRCDRTELQRHLPQQLRQERPRAVVPVAAVEAIWAAIEADPATEITVDMERLTVEVPAAGITESFPMDPQTQHRFLNGLDDVGITMTHADDITAFESRRPAWL